MGIVDRLRRLWRSQRTVGDDRLGERLDSTYRAQVAQVQRVDRALADLSTARRRVELQLAKARTRSSESEARAAEHVAAGRDDAARAELATSVSLTDVIAELEQRHATLVADEQKLAATAEALRTQVEEFRWRKDTLVARQSAAQARDSLQRATTGVGAIDAEATMAAAEQHTRELEARSEAIDELVAEGLIDGPGGPVDAAAARWEREFDSAAPAPTTGPTGGDDDGAQPVSR